jgi:hypothetical protein
MYWSFEARVLKRSGARQNFSEANFAMRSGDDCVMMFVLSEKEGINISFTKHAFLFAVE